jgi:hypothetical protein
VVIYRRSRTRALAAQGLEFGHSQPKTPVSRFQRKIDA